MPKWLKFAAAVLLLPACWGVTRALVRVVGVSSAADTFWVAFLAGFAAWLTVFLLLPRPVRIYILGHELTHALWTWAMGGRVKGLKVGKAGGQVVVNRANCFVILAPYFFPLYAVLLVALFLVGDLIWDWQRQVAWFHLLLGAAYGFHLTFTVQVLGTRQSDITSQGWLFSLVLIWLGNVLTLVLGLALLTGRVPVLAALGWCWQDTGRVFLWLSRHF